MKIVFGGSRDEVKTIKYLVIDVDGTLTDSGIYYDETGNELKKFCTKDAAGFFAAQKAGIKIIILTGRECKATKRRMEEMKVDYLYQDIKDKTSFLQEFMKKNNLIFNRKRKKTKKKKNISSQHFTKHSQTLTTYSVTKQFQ